MLFSQVIRLCQDIQQAESASSRIYINNVQSAGTDGKKKQHFLLTNKQNMRKLKLLMMTVCALMGAGQTWAQKWVDVTSFYLKNADFEGSYSVQKTFQSGTNNERCVYKPSDWTVTHDNENDNDITILKTGDKQSASFKYFDLKPTDGGDQAYLVRFRWGGQYWSNGLKGSTDQITLSQTQTIPSGKYRLSADLVFITAEETPSGHLRIYADKTAGGSLGYVDANIIKGTREGETIKSGSASWALKTTDEFDLDDATETKFAIEFTQSWRWEIQAGADNYRLERKCPDGAYTIDVASSVCSSTDNWSLKSGTFDNGSYAEHWVNDMPTSGDYLKFTLGNVPNGTYQVKVTAKSSNTGSRDSNVTPVSNDGGTNYASIVAGDVEQPIPTWNALDATTGASPQQYTLSNIMVTDGNLVVALKVKETGPNWMIAKIDEIEYQGSYLYDYNSALAAAEAAIANNDYDNITGSERTILQEEIDKDKPTTPDGYVEATAALIEKTSTFITAKSSYDAFAAEKASAIAMGVSSDDADDIRPSSASGLQDALRALYVLEDVATKTNYTIDATNMFGSWTTQNLDTKNDQHWSGTTVTYYDRWQNSGYTSSITSTVTLPAGKYVFKLAARAQTGSINGAFNMSVKVGDNDAVYKDFVAKNSTGKGITTSGAVSYSDGEFCNDGAGRGWEWRFIGFELGAEASVTLKGYAQIYANNWVGFSDATLLTTTDNIEICRQLYESSKDAAEAARENEDYNIVIGTERATLNAAIDEEVPEPVTYSWYQIQKAALDEATAALINAKPAYVALSEVNNTVAAELGVSTVPAATSSSTAADITAALNTQNVDEYTAATTNYTYNATSLLGAWSNAPGNNHGQSWNGTTGDGSDEYYDLYNAAARSMTQTVTLPKAKYVLIAKGRASTDGRLTLSDGTNTITFPHKGNEGKGIETNGIPNFGSGTYSNDGNGNGWEYRFLTFESDGSTSTTLTFNWTTASNNWAGLDDITLLASDHIITVSPAGFATYVPSHALDFSDATIKAYKVKVSTKGIATLTKVDKVPADTPVLLYKENGATEAIPVTASADAVSDNDLVAGTGEAVPTTDGAGNTNMILNVVDKQIGFYFANNKTVATDRAYLHIASSLAPDAEGSGSRMVMVFADETTGVNDVRSKMSEVRGTYYNLNGQRVEKPAKGLYIVNGKKVIIK